MKKEEALKILFKSAQLYKENLVNNNLLFICMDKHKRTSSLTIQFATTGFLHLTGVKFNDRKSMSSGEFFDKCLKRRLSLDEFELAKDGTTEKKLQILSLLFSKNLSATIVRDFSARTPVLVTDKLVGGVKGCIGFVYERTTGFYAPNTVLNLDIRTYISNQLRIIATYRKKKTDSGYEEIVYAAKKIDWEKIKYPQGFEDLPKPDLWNK